MLSPAAQASVLLASLAVFALCLYVAWRIWRPAPHAPRDRFRFVESLAPALSDVGLVIREDVGPGGLFRIIAAGPFDTSPRAGAGHDVLADCNLQRTERASWLAQELAPESLRAIYDARLTIFAELNPGPGGGGHGLPDAAVVAIADGYALQRHAFQAEPTAVGQSMQPQRPDWMCAACEKPHICEFHGGCRDRWHADRLREAQVRTMLANTAPPFLGDFSLSDPLGVTATDCTTGECPTPSVCRQVGGCADAVPTVDPRD